MALTVGKLSVGNLLVGNLAVGRLVNVTSDPLGTAARSSMLVPRVPIRFQTDDGEADVQTEAQAKPGPFGKQPKKIDPRSVRASEIVGMVINGLARTASIFKSSVDNWIVPAKPRECADADSFNGELFYSTDTLSLKYRTPGGTLLNVTTTP